MKYDYIELFIPEVKVYGFVFVINDEPVLFIIDGNNILDGIPIYNEFEDIEFEEEDGDIEFEEEKEEDIYTLLDEDETIMVGVEVLDDDYNEIQIKDITDDNYEEFIYNLVPLKFHTVNFKDITMSEMIETDKFKNTLLEVMNDYKDVLKKSK